MAKNINESESQGVSLVNVYIELEILKKHVAKQDDLLKEILLISKQNQEKLADIDGVKQTLKKSWKLIIFLMFFSFIVGVVIDDIDTVKKVKSTLTLT